jgi:hypothetical protein
MTSAKDYAKADLTARNAVKATIVGATSQHHATANVRRAGGPTRVKVSEQSIRARPSNRDSRDICTSHYLQGKMYPCLLLNSIPLIHESFARINLLGLSVWELAAICCQAACFLMLPLAIARPLLQN